MFDDRDEEAFGPPLTLRQMAFGALLVGACFLGGLGGSFLFTALFAVCA